VPHNRKAALDSLLDRCLVAFVEAGTLDLSLDQLASKVGSSKRMLVHYFGGRENIEEGAMTRLEVRLRARFATDSFPPGATPEVVVTALWNRATAPESRSVLLLVMDLSRRAWNGSKRAKAFYEEQQRLWVELLLKFLPDQAAVEEVLQLFQGSVLAYLITGDRESGRRALIRALARRHKTRRRLISRKKTRNAKPV
jgi:AcrR family transcriptional regulator